MPRIPRMIANHYQWKWGDALPPLRRHSEVKHSLLRAYLVEYFLTLVSTPAQDRIQLTIVDGFCGGGRYLNEAGVEVPGSPLVILEAIKEAEARLMLEQQRRKPFVFDVELICIDESANAIHHLRKVLAEQGYGAQLQAESIRTLVGDFASLAASVTARADARSPQSGRSIFVLDQYGYDAVPQEALANIFRVLKRAEVILTFNVASLLNYLSAKNMADFERKTGFTGNASPTDLDKKSRGPHWRLHIQSSLYQSLTRSSGAQFFTPFFIRPERGHGDFWLLHLSKHWKARDVMAAAHWQHHNHFGHYGQPGFDMLSTGYVARIDPDARVQQAFEFDDAAKAASRSAMLLQIPTALLMHRDGIKFDDFFLARMNTTPATKKMVEKTVLELVHEREIQVVGTDGTLRHVRTALKNDHVLRLPQQRAFSFGGG